MTSSAIVSGTIITAIPIIQIGVLYRLFWVPDYPTIDRKECECSCFDGVFKGSYEAGSSKHGYKHVYFNATYQTMCAWIITVLYILLGYEALKSFLSLLLSRSLRPVMAFLFCLSIYPHIYAWFAFFNYYNDDFYPMFRHQVYFAITEVISSYAILRSCDRNEDRQRWLYSLVVGTAFVHLVIGGLDQFVSNLFFNKGRPHQVWRDIGLASPDLINIILPVLDCMRSDKDGLPGTKPTINGSVFSSVKNNYMSASRNMKLVSIYSLIILVLGLYM